MESPKLNASHNNRAFRLTKEFVEAIKATGERQTFRDTKSRGLILRVGAKAGPDGSPKKTWAYDYRDPEGKRQTYKLGYAPNMTPGDAREALKKLGPDPAGDRRREREHKRRSASRTIKAFLEGAYQSEYLNHRKSGQATLKRIKSAWKPFLDDDMATLDAMEVVKHRAKRLAKGIKPQTLNRDRVALLAMLNQAVKWRIIDKNPLDDPAFHPLEMADHKRVRWLGQRDHIEEIKDPGSDEKLGERQRFLKALKEAPNYLQWMVRLAMNTGMRRGEIFGLRWEHVSLNRREILVHADTVKTNATRHIPINDDVFNVLTEAGEVRSISGYVFVNPDTGTRFGHVKRSWAALVERAQLQDFTFHDLRHDYASRLVQAGVDLYTVRDLLGHSSITLTERYAHLRPDAKHKAVAVLMNEVEA